MTAAAALGLVGVVAFGRLMDAWLSTGPLLPLRAAAVFALVMAFAIGAAPRHPFPYFGPANLITTWRAVLVALIAGLIWGPANASAAWAVVVTTAVVAALDGVDGWAARRTRMIGDFGARFDMEVDALLILVLSILVWRYEKADGWVLACGLMRYAFVGAGWAVPWMAGRLRSTIRGKAIAVWQFVGLSIALAPPVTPPASAIVAGLTLAALTWSFALDVAWLWRQRTV